MTINEWDTLPIPRSTVLWVVHYYILLPVTPWIFFFLEMGLSAWRSIEPLCPPRIEWVSPPLWVTLGWGRGVQTLFPLITVFTQG